MKAALPTRHRPCRSPSNANSPTGTQPPLVTSHAILVLVAPIGGISGELQASQGGSRMCHAIFGCSRSLGRALIVCHPCVQFVWYLWSIVVDNRTVSSAQVRAVAADFTLPFIISACHQLTTIIPVLQAIASFR